jgi:hypothetical protein
MASSSTDVTALATMGAEVRRTLTASLRRAAMRSGRLPPSADVAEAAGGPSDTSATDAAAIQLAATLFAASMGATDAKRATPAPALPKPVAMPRRFNVTCIAPTPWAADGTPDVAEMQRVAATWK